MTPEEIFAGLNPEQAEAAATIEGPVLVLAGAGTGKTRVITYRIAGMLASGIPAENILGLTFTNKAAREMRERLAQLVNPEQAKAVTLGTFHSFCVRLLRREAGLLGYLPGFTIADDSDQQGLIKQAGAALGLLPGTYSVPESISMISGWKNQLLTPRQARNRAATDHEVIVGSIYEEYQRLLEMQNMIDFDDMLMLVWRLFTEFPEALKKCQERYRYLLVDEYQDTSAAQFEVVRLLAGETHNLCAVGDDDQSIYSWRGADIGNILAFPEQFPGAKVIKLEQNYRSTSRILSAANAVLSGNTRRHTKKLWSDLGEGDMLDIVTTPSAEEEARFAANCILQLRNEDMKRKYSDFAILYRSNHLSREFEMQLRGAGIPYRLVGGQEFYKRKEIKDAVAYLKLLINPRDDQSLLRILACPPRGLADKAVNLLKKQSVATHEPMVHQLGSAEFQQALGGKGAAQAAALAEIFTRYRALFKEPGSLAARVESFLRETGYLDGLQRMYKDIKDATKRRENVDEFITAVAQFEQRSPEPARLDDYLESFALLEETDRTEEENEDAVTLSSVHASKGLEYPVVFVVGMEHGLFPHERSVEEGSEDEELRLFYVAITRARKKLYLSRAKTRMTRGITHMPRGSEFLDLLPEDLANRHTPENILKAPDPGQMQQVFADIFKMLDEED